MQKCLLLNLVFHHLYKKWKSYQGTKMRNSGSMVIKHMSMNAESNLFTGLEVSSGNEWDGKHFTSLVDTDMKQGLPVETYAADRGYDDGNNHFYLEHKGLHSAILLKDNRLKKKDSNKEVWEELVRTKEYQQQLC